MSNKQEKCCKKTKIGGQALIEGIMMKGVSKGAMAVRMKDGSIDVEEWDIKPAKWYNKAPFIRGSINFVSSLSEGYKCMMKSAEKSGMLEEEENYEPSKFEKWLDDKLGDKLTGVIMAIAMVIGVALAILLFAVVPTALYDWIETLMPLTPDAVTGELVPMDISMWQSTFEGIMRMILFIGYMALVSKMKDIRRTFEYHGAEHKSIACYEAGEELTAENAKKYSRFHPRCGTSFLIVVLIISIILTFFINWDWPKIVVMLVKLLMMIPVVGISFEFLIWAGKHPNRFTRILSAPGMWMQRATTKEPDLSQLEVAIAALKASMPDEFPPEPDAEETEEAANPEEPEKSENSDLQ